ncbi:Smr/MutS family protein [Christensenellaceae bacterium OttesenSCG-928-L17]|nr:Smr/MutS family protein [Christensenellaceae bacterium OttesenSCG-928-L17]
MATAGIVELDLHGMTKVQAQTCVDAALRRAGAGVYRLRLIHGYTRGTELRDMLRAHYKKHPRVLRVELSLNQGQTELVLREY